MVLRPLLAAALFTITASVMTGCAAQQQAATGAPKTPDALAFEKPSDIKPANSTIEPAPLPVAAPKAVTTPNAVRVAGNWTPPVAPRDWHYIVIHHSASPTGNAAIFDREHRDKGWDELGYHFVIDNGRGGPDGNIEIGPRWLKQKWGAHAKTPDNRYNDFGIGICFVGNFEQGKPTAKQLASAERLVAWLMQTYNIPAKNVIGHEDTGKQTLCPGKYMSVAAVRQEAVREIAEAGATPVPMVQATDMPMDAHLAMVPETHELMQSSH